MSARAWMAFAALGVIWGVPYFFIKIAVQELSPWVVAWGRITLAALVLLPIAWHRGALHALGEHKLPILVFGLIEFVIPFSAISIGERWIDSSVTGILIASVPLTVYRDLQLVSVQLTAAHPRVRCLAVNALQPVGHLDVAKAINGTLAGLQDAVKVAVTCDDGTAVTNLMTGRPARNSAKPRSTPT